MESETSTAEFLRFGEGDRLGGVLHYPDRDTARLAVLLCSPHPNFAGDMENNVIVALANKLAAECIVLRFDYRGIGQSRIDLPTGMSVFDYWDNVEQTHDYSAAMADTACAADALWRISNYLPIVSIGYSFGAMTATRQAIEDARITAIVGIGPPLQRITFDFLSDCRKPCLMLSGEDDFVYDPEVAAMILDRSGPSLKFERLTGVDHFFRGQEPMLAERVAEFVRVSSRGLLDASSRSTPSRG